MCRFDLEGNKKTLKIGDNCEFGDYTHIVALNHVEIGNDVLIASKVFISDTNHGNYSGNRQSSPSTPPRERTLIKGSVTIGDKVWIGENAVILSGSKIGNGCIIGANSVISKEIPDNSIVIGANKILRQYGQS
jgi:acetyltransferase-like isoleucine patch superfamily enzyme